MRYILICFVSFLLLSCTENDRMTFVGKPGVYFEDYNNDDTIKYSFNMTPYDKDTLLIDVKLMGPPVTGKESFRLEVLPTSTAKAGVHYVELPTLIDFPIQTVTMQLPIVLCDGDEALNSSTVFLQLQLQPTDAMDLGFPDNTLLNISITNMLIKPEYWDKNFIDWFGEYSKVKHEKCIELMGHDFPLTYEEASSWNELGLKYWMLQGRKLVDYFVKNPTRDENGNWIEPWEPA